MADKTQDFDLIVIGAGPGGYVAALDGARRGARVALVEKDLVGGTCLNRGCIPSKTFLSVAEMMHDLRERAPGFGLTAGEPALDWSKTMARKEKVLAEQRKGLEFLFTKRSVELLHGEAVFESAGRVRVRGGSDEDRLLVAERVIIASGSRPARVSGWPEDERVVTSDEALDWKDIPRSLLIVGGGVIGCEFACMMREFGAEVTIVEMLPRLLPLMDESVGDELRKVFTKRGIACHVDARVAEMESGADGVRATLGDGTALNVERVLVATGRRPNVEGLNLEGVGIAVEKGRIAVNSRMATSVAGHYAIGDVNGLVPLAHSASAMGHIAVANALSGAGDKPHEFDAPNPWCVYTFPGVGGVGLGESEARDKGLPIACGSFPFAASGKARAFGDATGFTKVIRHRETNEILGIHAIGHGATEFIAAAGVLLHTHATARDVTEMVFAHPTMGESIRDAAEAALFEPIHLAAPRVRRIKV